MNPERTEPDWSGQLQDNAGVLPAMVATRRDRAAISRAGVLRDTCAAGDDAAGFENIEASADPEDDEDEDDGLDEDLDDLEEEDEELEDEIEEEIEGEMEEENKSGSDSSDEQLAQRVRNEGVPLGGGVIESEEQVAQRIRNEGLQVGERVRAAGSGRRNVK